MSKTVKVRIGVGIDSEGNWSATGWSTDQTSSYDAEVTECVLDWQDDGAKVYWLEAELYVPVSEPEVVQPTVTEAN